MRVLLDRGHNRHLVFVIKDKPMLCPYSNRLVSQSWNMSNGIAQKRKHRGSWTSYTTPVAKGLLRTWCCWVRQESDSKSSIQKLMQLITTRIVSRNMTSFLVLNHERVGFFNGPLKPNNNHWWDHLANDNINHLQGASTLRLQNLDDSLAKEPISTQVKRATWTLDTKDKKQISIHLSKTIARI